MEPFVSPEQTSKPSDQNGELERFCQVVVCSRLEASQHVLWLIARRQHQQRHELSSLPQFCRNLETTLSGKHHIKNDQVERPVRREEQGERGLAVTRNLDLISLGFEIETEAIGEVFLVLHYQNAGHLVLASDGEGNTVCPLCLCVSCILGPRKHNGEGAPQPLSRAFRENSASVAFDYGPDNEEPEPRALHLHDHPRGNAIEPFEDMLELSTSNADTAVGDADR